MQARSSTCSATLPAGLSDVCDVERLRDVARGAPQLDGVAEVKSLVSAIGASLTLLGEEEPVLPPAAHVP